MQTSLVHAQDPQPSEPWKGVLNATAEPLPAWHRDQFSSKIIGTEDCLRLNVFTKEVN